MSQRSAFLTINNPDMEKELKSVMDWKTTWVAVGFHVGEENKIPHYHVAAQFKSTVRFSAIKKRFPTAHIEVLRGKEQEIIDYLSKYEGQLRYEAGTFKEKRQGKRTDIERWKEDVIAGVPHIDLVREHTALYVRYGSGCRDVEQALRPKKKTKIYENFNRELLTDFSVPIILIGGTGLGKTQYAKASMPNALFIRHIDQLKDADLSGGIIFDDMDFKHWPRESQIHLLDTDEDSAIHVRYSHIDIPAGTPKIFTCNYMPFTDDPAIQRRYKVVQINTPLF